MSIFTDKNTNDVIDKFIVEGLIKIFDETYVIIKVFRQTRDRFRESTNVSI